MLNVHCFVEVRDRKKIVCLRALSTQPFRYISHASPHNLVKFITMMKTLSRGKLENWVGSFICN